MHSIEKKQILNERLEQSPQAKAHQTNDKHQSYD